MANLRIDEAYLLGSWSSAALWGIFTFLFIVAIVQIVQLREQGRMSRSKWITSAAMITLYCLATTHTSLELRRVVIGFVDIQGPGTIPYFADIGQRLNIGKDFVYITSIIIADIIVAWRCYVIWQANKYVVAVLVTLVLGTITAGYGAIAQYFLNIEVNLRQSISFGYAMYSISLATNVITTFLTVGRVWWESRTLSRAIAHNLGSNHHRSSTYRTLLLILIESGLFIGVAKIIEFVMYKVAPDDGLNGCNGLYVIFDMIPQINGIVPTLIIILVNAKKTITDAHNLVAVSTFKANAPAQSSTMVFAANGLDTERHIASEQSVFSGYDKSIRNRHDDKVVGIPLEAMHQKDTSESSQV